ncbi:hypothetical protein BJX96DRAFT_180566 [Aspergillus floccosus]
MTHTSGPREVASNNYKRKTSISIFRSFPRSGDVRESRGQFWQHVPGNEYLAANPLYVPGLQTILLDAARDEDELGKRKYTPLQVDRDVFTSLPHEILLLVVNFLDASDLQNLRLASKAFTTLPNSVWQRLVREEMPWLWEAWCDSEVHIPSFWTTVTAYDLLFFRAERERYLAQVSDVCVPASKAVEYLLPFPKEGPQPLKLPRNYQLAPGLHADQAKLEPSQGATESPADLGRCGTDSRAY